MKHSNDMNTKKGVQLTITKLGIAACEKMFKTGTQVVKIPDSDEKMIVVTTLTHEQFPIDFSRAADSVNPIGPEGSTRQIHVWGIELGIEFLLDSLDGETVQELILRSLHALNLKNPKKVPSNFIVVRSNFCEYKKEDQPLTRMDSYYNYTIDDKDRKKIKTAMKQARFIK